MPAYGIDELGRQTSQMSPTVRQKTGAISPMLGKCCGNVVAIGHTLIKHWVKIMCLLNDCCQCTMIVQRITHQI